MPRTRKSENIRDARSPSAGRRARTRRAATEPAEVVAIAAPLEFVSREAPPEPEPPAGAPPAAVLGAVHVLPAASEATAPTSFEAADTHDARPATALATSGVPLQVLTFVVAGNEYGIEIHHVQELRGYTRLALLPNMPRHLRGLLDVRGTVVPVFDLRAWFGGEPVECTPLTVIVTVQVGERLAGLLVDSVSDVRELDRAALEAAPDLGRAVDTSLLDGLAPVDGRLLCVLDLGRVVGGMLAA